MIIFMKNFMQHNHTIMNISPRDKGNMVGFYVFWNNLRWANCYFFNDNLKNRIDQTDVRNCLMFFALGTLGSITITP
jgi:hypothetical protein